MSIAGPAVKSERKIVEGSWTMVRIDEVPQPIDGIGPCQPVQKGKGSQGTGLPFDGRDYSIFLTDLRPSSGAVPVSGGGVKVLMAVEAVAEYFP